MFKSTQPTEGQLLSRSTCNNVASLESTGSLLYAVEYGNIDVIKVLLRQGVNVNTSNENGFTALHLAVLYTAKRHHYTPIGQDFVESETKVRTLLIAGANVEAKSNCGFTPLHLAVLLKRYKAVFILLENGANSHSPIQFHSCKSNFTECLTSIYLIELVSKERFYNFRHWEHYQTTLLHVAVRTRNIEILNMLLQSGSAVNAVESDGKTPLMAAIEYVVGEDMLIYNTLMDHGADGSITDTNGMNALHYAIKSDKRLVVKDLVKRGVPVNTPDNYGKTPLMFAIERGYEEVVEILLSNNADPDYSNQEGSTPFHIACEHLNVKIVKLLLNYGADYNLPCNSGMTPYDIAILAERKYRESKDGTFQLWPFERSSKTLCSFQPDGHSLYDKSMIHHHAKLQLQILHSHVNMMGRFGIKLHTSHEVNLAPRVAMHFYSKNVSQVVESFKRRIVAHNLSVYQLIHMRDPVYVLNKDVMLKLKNLLDELGKNEPGENIRNVMSYVIRKAKLKLKLLEYGQNRLMEIFKKVENILPFLPVEICRNILSYLDEEGIQQTVKVL